MVENGCPVSPHESVAEREVKGEAGKDDKMASDLEM